MGGSWAAGPPGKAETGLAQEMHAALSASSTINVLVLDPSLRVHDLRWDPKHFDGFIVRRGQQLTDLLHPDDCDDAAALLHEVLDTGGPVLSMEHRIWRLRTPTNTSVKFSAMRSPHGLVVTVVDYREQAAREKRQQLVEESAVRIGSRLDVMRTARELAEVMVPLFADYCAIDLAEEITAGLEPPLRTHGGDLRLRRAATAPADHDWPEGYLGPGQLLPRFGPTTVIQMFQSGEPFHVPERSLITAVVDDDPGMVRQLVPGSGELTLLGIPLVTEREEGDEPGLLLGSAALWWRGRHEVTEDDVRVARGVCRRAAVSIDNARRHQREIDLVRRLRRTMLPGRVTTRAADTAARYAPAATGQPGGDWWDVVPLSSRRVALIIGDAVGHGLDATAMMGRLRTTARSFAGLDQTPDELLTHLDDLVSDLAAEHPQEGQEGPIGTTCCVAIWDSVRHHLAVASAGHPAPLLIDPDGHVEPVPVDPGPPLGLGLLPFEVTEINDVRTSSTLVLFSDGLIHDRRQPDVAVGLEALREGVTGLRAGDDLDARAERLMRQAKGSDDATVLFARLHGISADHTTVWSLPAHDESQVSAARRHVRNRLDSWGAGGDLTETATLIVSELVTNAIRYGVGSETVELRLIRDDDALIIEVADGANTSPRLKRARVRDEGGRGLMIVAQLSNARWGTRYHDPGKTIWTQIPWYRPPLPSPGPVTDLDLDSLDLDNALTSIEDMGD